MQFPSSLLDLPSSPSQDTAVSLPAQPCNSTANKGTGAAVSHCNIVIHSIKLRPCRSPSRPGFAPSCRRTVLIIQGTCPQAGPVQGLSWARCHSCLHILLRSSLSLSGDSVPYACHFPLIHLACHLKAVLIIVPLKGYSTGSYDCGLIKEMKTHNYNQSKYKTIFGCKEQSKLFRCFSGSHPEATLSQTENLGIQDFLCTSVF